jgi:hypothetical protein
LWEDLASINGHNNNSVLKGVVSSKENKTPRHQRGQRRKYAGCGAIVAGRGVTQRLWGGGGKGRRVEADDISQWSVFLGRTMIVPPGSSMSLLFVSGRKGEELNICWWRNLLRAMAT